MTTHPSGRPTAQTLPRLGTFPPPEPLPFLDAALFYCGAHDLLVLNQNPELTPGHFDFEEHGAYAVDLP